MITVPIDGIAANRPCTTLRILGIAETSRKARNIRSARRTERLPPVGIRATATIVKSNIFQPFLKNLSL